MKVAADAIKALNKEFEKTYGKTPMEYRAEQFANMDKSSESVKANEGEIEKFSKVVQSA